MEAIAGITGILIGLVVGYLCGFWDGKFDTTKKLANCVRSGNFEVKGTRYEIKMITKTDRRVEDEKS